MNHIVDRIRKGKVDIELAHRRANSLLSHSERDIRDLMILLLDYIEKEFPELGKK